MVTTLSSVNRIPVALQAELRRNLVGDDLSTQLIIRDSVMKIFILIVLTSSLMLAGCGKRKTTPPPEVDQDVSEIEIDFGDEFLPIDGGIELTVGE